MKVHVFKNEDAASIAAAMLVCAQVLKKPNSVLGLEAKENLLSTYQKLIAFHRAGALALQNVSTFLASEYCTLSKQSSDSMSNFMQRNLYNYVDIVKENIHSFQGDSPDLKIECLRYESLIKQVGGVDLQLLTLGDNAAIAGNEPALNLLNECHVQKLSQFTLDSTQVNFTESEPVPTELLTLGIGTLLRADTLIVLAFGRKQAEAARDLVRGSLDPLCPASFLQLHREVIVLLDEAAASLI